MSRGSQCARPACGQPSTVVITYDYAAMLVYIDSPGQYDAIGAGLCDRHADRTTPPMGWQLIDRRVVTPLHRFGSQQSA